VELRRPPGPATVARRVGYSGAFALSAAFKRVRGVSPKEFRAGITAPATEPGPRPPRTVVLDGPGPR
ncbi:AraC family transcriptional regulator, partial [Streptomyces sp. NPDC051130]